MAHERERFLTPLIKECLRFSPLVGVLGHRQVGKTTVVQRLATHYETLDLRETLKKAEQNPTDFINSFSGLGNAIDECQLVPDLFPALKEHVRKNKRPGQFIMSGSVRFSSRKAIRESLTGRIVNLELLPFTVGELLSESPTINLKKIIESPHIERLQERFSAMNSTTETNQKNSAIKTYFENGGLPGVCFIRKEDLRSMRLREQLITILDRDLRLVYPTTLPLQQLIDFVSVLARLEGKVINHQNIYREIGISTNTQKKLLYALEAIFLIRTLPTSLGGHVVYFEDQAETLYLNNFKLEEIQKHEGFIFRHARTHFTYQIGLRASYFQFRTRAGVRVPLVVETPQGILGFIFLENNIPDRSQMAAARALLAQHTNSKVLFISVDNKWLDIDKRIAVVPLNSIV